MFASGDANDKQHEQLIYESGMHFYNELYNANVQTTHKMKIDYKIAIGAIQKIAHVTIICSCAK